MRTSTSTPARALDGNQIVRSAAGAARESDSEIARAGAPLRPRGHHRSRPSPVAVRGMPAGPRHWNRGSPDLLEGEYEPSPAKWVRDQVETYEATGGREANVLRGNKDWPIVVYLCGARSPARLRKNPVMRPRGSSTYVSTRITGCSCGACPTPRRAR